MGPRRAAAATACLIALASLAPLAAAETAWEETWELGTGNWSHESGSSPQTVAAQGYAGTTALRTPSGSWSLSRSVGWATTGESQVSLHFRTSSTSGAGGFTMSADFTAPDGVSTGTVWVAVDADGGNTMSWGTSHGSWPIYKHDGSIFQPAANTWHFLTINLWDGDGGQPEAIVWVQDDLGGATYSRNDWHPYGPALWRFDTVRIVAEGSGRTVYMDNVKVWSVAQISAPNAPSDVQAKPGPNLCPALIDPVCPFATVDGNDILVTWSRPFDGNAPLVRYVVEITSASGVEREDVGLLTRFIDRDLAPGLYTYNVYAENVVGTSLPSAPATTVTLGVA